MELFWHCECGAHERAEEPYEHGDQEPCIDCGKPNYVVTLAEAAKAEQAQCFGGPRAAREVLRTAARMATARRATREGGRT